MRSPCTPPANGPRLSTLAPDVPGVSLAGPALETAHGRGPAAQGRATGASGRRCDGDGANLDLPASQSEADRALPADPQTSGGLLEVA